MSLNRLQEAAQLVLDNWEKGDLAFAVRYLEAALETSKSDSYKAQVREEIEQGWLARTKTMEYGKPHTVTYRRKEIEFFCGAMQALNAVMPRDDGRITDLVPPAWILNPMTGRNVVEAK